MEGIVRVIAKAPEKKPDDVPTTYADARAHHPATPTKPISSPCLMTSGPK